MKETPPREINNAETLQESEGKIEYRGEQKNIVRELFEISPASQEQIKGLKATLGRTLEKVYEYEHELHAESKDGDIDEPELNRRRWKISAEISKIKAEFGYVNYYEHTASTRLVTGTEKQRSTYQHHKYLPETIEAAFLANDAEFESQLSELQSKLAEHNLLSFSRAEHDDSDAEKFNHFLKSLRNIPRNDKDKITNWLLNPSNRLAHSIFTHVTSELALANIIKDKKLKSANLIPEAGQTGAYTAEEVGATPLEKSAVYFDQNSITLGYGVGAKALQRQQRRIWFITRGDFLLQQGLIGDRNAFERRHPFTPGHNRFGAAFIKNDQGTEVSIENLIIVIPPESDDLKSKIQTALPSALVITYSSAYYHPETTRKRDPDVNTIREFTQEFKAKLGSVKVPKFAISVTDALHDTGSTRLRFPVTVRLQGKSNT